MTDREVETIINMLSEIRAAMPSQYERIYMQIFCTVYPMSDSRFGDAFENALDATDRLMPKIIEHINRASGEGK